MGGFRASGRAVGLLRRDGSGQQSTFVELFFDLAVVFTLNRVVTHSVPGLLGDDPGQRWASVGRTVLLFVAVMWLWTTTAFITSRFEPRRAGTQVMLLGSTFAMVLMGTAVAGVFAGGGVVFAVAFVTTQVVRSVVVTVGLRPHRLRRLYGRISVWFCLAGVLWVGGAIAGGAAVLVWWSVAVVVDLGSARLGWPVPWLGRGRTTTWQVAGGHMTDRYSQLLMIALGESILAVGISFGGHKSGVYETGGLVVAFATTVLLWRVYFFKAGELVGEALHASGDPAGWGRKAGFAHAVMVAGIVATAIGHKIVQSSYNPSMGVAWLAMILGGPVLFLAGRSRLEHLVFDRVSRRRLVAIAALAVISPLAVRATPLGAATAAALVLLLIAVLDWRNAAGQPAEAASPPAPGPGSG